ncbi:MAG: hypothetical protein WCD79_07745 [Chthoniobacteraceae bacterium]
MKPTTALLLTMAFLPLLSFADDFSLSDGREFKGVTVSRVEKDGVVVITDDGVEKLPFALLPKEARDLYPYVPSPTPAPQPTAPPPPAPTVQTGADTATAVPQASPSPTARPLTSLPATVASTIKQAGIPPRDYLAMVLKTLLALFVALFALGCAAFIIKRLLDNWQTKQKAREFDATNLKQFHSAYADFFAVMKLWNHCIEHNEDELPSAGEYELPHATRWELLTRTYMVESSLEAIFLKISAAWNLTPVEIELLGRFRQAIHTLGNSIKNNKPLNWDNPDQGEYLIFNRLASSVARLIGGENATAKTSEQHAEAFRQITSPQWQRIWNLTDTEAQAKGLPPAK